MELESIKEHNWFTKHETSQTCNNNWKITIGHCANYLLIKTLSNKSASRSSASATSAI